MRPRSKKGTLATANVFEESHVRIIRRHSLFLSQLVTNPVKRQNRMSPAWFEHTYMVIHWNRLSSVRSFFFSIQAEARQHRLPEKMNFQQKSTLKSLYLMVLLQDVYLIYTDRCVFGRTGKRLQKRPFKDADANLLTY